MSLILKGVNLPSDDKLLNIDISSSGEVWVNRGNEWDYYKNSAIEIPNPHGRLIDGDEIVEAHYKYCNEHHGEADVFYMWSKNLMDNAPTILEVEN